MKKFYLFIAFIFTVHFAFSAPVIKSIKDGYWNQASTWNLNRLPEVGDTIIIVAGNTVTVNNDINLSDASFLKVYGKLNFQNNNSTLTFANGSFIWVFPGALIIGGGSASQKLRLNGVAIFNGNDEPVYGPVMASVSSNGFAAMVNTNPITLPVVFVGFTATLQGKDVLIQWSTSQEISANMYQVERSVDGITWSTVFSMPATGNASIVSNYSYTDKNIPGKAVHYRIKEIDVDGKSNFTAIRSVKTNNISAGINIGSVNNKVLLRFSQEIKGNLTIRFISANGQVIDQQNITNPVGQIVLNSKLTGNYIVSITNGQDINAARQVML